MSMKFMRKIIMACAAWVCGSFAAPAIWDGTADDSWYEPSAQAYNLTTAEQLAGLAKLVNDGNTFAGKTITLGADIFLNDTTGAGAGTWASIARTPWTPIGTSSRPFQGEFDGIAGKKNRKIYGLYFNDTTKSNVGLFGYTDRVKISNLDLPVGRVTAANNTGALIGYAISGSVTNVHSGVKVTGKNKVGGLVGYSTGSLNRVSVQENVTGQDSVGGLVGYTSGSVSGTTNDNSFFVGDVSGRRYVGGATGYGSSISKTYVEGAVKGYGDVGGLSGYTKNGVIESSYHIGGNVMGDYYVGGLVGTMIGSVTGSYSEGTVNGANYVGGLAGYTSGTVSGSHAKGSVNGTSYVGGLAGYVTGSVTGSHSQGEIIGKGNYVGGVAGYTTGSVLYSHSEGNVTGKGNYVGGLIGISCVNYSDTDSKTWVVVANSYSNGNIKGSNYVGGAIGLDSVYRNSFNNSAMIRNFEKINVHGKVEGNDYVGGIIGKMNYQYNSSYPSGFKANIDSVSHNGEVNGRNYIGGIAGNIYGSVSNTQSEGNVTGTGNYVGGLLGKLIYTRTTGTTSNALDTVRLKDSYAIGNVKGAYYVGGLVGKDSLHKSLAKSSTNSSTKILYRLISNAYSKGNVEGKLYVGGLIGVQNRASDTARYAGDNTYIYTLIDSCYHDNGSVKGDSSYIGGLVGSTYGFVNHSHSSGDVQGFAFVGGLIGNGIKVNASYAVGAVNGVSSYVGGLVGCARYIVNGTSYLQGPAWPINSSYHKGGDVSGGMLYVGGLAGDGSVSNSHSEGAVSGAGSVGGLTGSGEVSSSYHIGGDVSGTGSYVGGLTGKGNVSNSYSEGNVTGLDYVGGAAGSSSKIRNSYAKASYIKGRNRVGGLSGYVTDSIIVSSFEGDSVTGVSYVGGLAGYASGSVIGSYSDGNVAGTGNYVGGLLGLLGYTRSTGTTSNALDTVRVKDSYAIGDVKGAYYVGGLVGKDSLHKSLAKSSTNSSTTILYRLISNAYSKGNVEGKLYVGGLIGVQNRASDTAKYATDTYVYTFIDSCYHDNGSIKGDSSYIGGLVGSTHGFINHSHSSGDVQGFAFVGGLIGNGTKVNASYAVGAVKGDSSYVGGLVGSVLTIDSSYHVGGDVSGTGNYVGGLTGSGSVSNSYSEGNVVGLDYVGGVVGSSSKIRKSYAIASYIKGRNHVGGLSGYVTGSIDVSYFEGDSVTGIFQVGGLAGYAKSAVDSSYSTANVKGDDNVGGLIGSAYGNVSNSYALGNVDGDVSNSSAGNDNLGGLVGYQYSGSVSKSMALGNITGTTKLGGLVGRFDGTSISQSYANGNVTGSYYGDPADEVGNYYIGGLVGYAKGSLNETYSNGIVKGMDKDPVYTGCMVGYVNGSLSVTKSYYDKSKCNLGIDGGENAVTLMGTPDKTTTEMQTQSTFEDWDFVDTWKILEKSYPFLQIYANSLNNATVETASLEGYKYDGTAKTPLVTSVKLFGETLEYETEYTIAYSNNVNAGTASINVCGVKPYGGCKVVNFEIAGITVKPTIAAIENGTYTGRALTPEIKVYSGETLLAATDYTVEYKDNINAGTATVVVTMKGNYSGSASKTFKIEKATPVISQNPKAGDVILGETLASSELTGGYANVEGKFVWKNSSTKPALENEGYTVVFVPTDAGNYTNSAEIVVPVKVLDMVYVAIHANGSTIDSVTILKGAEYSLPTVAEKTGFDFIGFYKGSAEVGKTGDKITITENTVIDAVYQIKKFGVTFLNGSVELQTSDVAYGEMPKYTGDTPIKTATAQYTYSFKGWTPELVKVTEKANYTAVFDSVVNKYVVTFVNAGETLQTDSLLYGEVPKYKGNSSPAKASTEQYDYTFKGWSPTITSVAGATTYTAVFDSTLRKYAITFKNGTTTLQTSSVAYGTKPSYTGSTPTKSSTDKYAYTFKGWNPSVETVTGTATYTAVFDSTLRKFAITFKNGTTTLQTSDVTYGIKPSYTGSTPTKTSTDKYSYTFKGWNPTITSVTGAATYTAVFDSTLRKYTITFKNGTTTLQRSDVAYGTKPSYTGNTPTKKATNKYTYKFKGWNPAIAAVTKAATYQAVFDSSKVTGLVEGRLASLGLSVRAISRSIQISAAPKNSTYAILDMQGRVLLKGRVESANFNIAVPQAGSYLVRVGNAARKVQVK